MTAPDQVQAATDRAAKRNEGGHHTTPRGLRHKLPPRRVEREKHVPSAKRPPSPRAEAELERMGPARPPLPSPRAEAELERMGPAGPPLTPEE